MSVMSSPLCASDLGWQTLLKSAFRSSAALLDYLGLNNLSVQDNDFPVLVPLPFAAKMRKSDPSCPLLRQVLPLAEEQMRQPGFSVDPLAETERYANRGLLHKYHGRVLVLLAGGCAVNCRYCFRRHFPYQQHQITMQRWQAICDDLQYQPDITEVIFSGGDPLLVSNQRLADYLSVLDTVPHVKTVRIHTRLPIVLPQRIDDVLLETLATTRFQQVMVVHSNHPQELCGLTADCFRALSQASVRLFNQSVLLKGVNDQASVVAALCLRLFEQGVIPYYLHCLDKVDGASHFMLSTHEAQQIHQQLQAQLPGYLVPRLVQDRPGMAYKAWVNA